MPHPNAHEAEHEIFIAAPAEAVYALIADVENWPRVFPPTIHVDAVERTGAEERIRIWATANGSVKEWTSRRVLDPQGLRIDFRQEVCAPPVAAMGGAWVIERRSETGTRLRLLHDYRAVGDDPEGLAWIDEAVDRNSRSELAALKANVEFAHSASELTFSFEDSVEIAGSAKDAYDYIHDAHLWPDRLPHVAKVSLQEETPGLQLLEMETRARDGSTHTTASYRVAFPHHRIAYKQVTLPALMNLHTGLWTFTEHGGGVTASSQHTVVINTDAITRILGPAATVADARSYVQRALSANSSATLGYAKRYAESAV
ncbi:aromatase/cyclase [Streptomyces sp.]|uniref:aromatase/cyclase n=1 Tax=Streptomyces sp. TaxID=1931 RepID=UPI002F418271